MTEYQLRDYRVKEGEMDSFIEAWKMKIVPLRKKFGFRVIGSWFSREENRFVWVVAWDGSGSFEQAHNKYYSSEERLAMKPDPASYLAKVDTIMVNSMA